MRQRNSSYSNGAAIISIAAYMSWEIRQFRLENETPGLFGYFNDMEAAA